MVIEDWGFSYTSEGAALNRLSHKSVQDTLRGPAKDTIYQFFCFRKDLTKIAQSYPLFCCCTSAEVGMFLQATLEGTSLSCLITNLTSSLFSKDIGWHCRALYFCLEMKTKLLKKKTQKHTNQPKEKKIFHLYRKFYIPKIVFGFSSPSGNCLV